MMVAMFFGVTLAALVVYTTVLAISAGAWPLAAIMWAFIACVAIDAARDE